jgi:hypothetical protein
LISLALAALVVPAAAFGATTDGSVVVRFGQAPDDTAVVQLDKFTGSIIGQVKGAGSIIIDAGPNCDDQAAQVVGAGRPLAVKGFDTAQQWSGTDFTFRAVGSKACTFTLIVYSANKQASGGRVFLVAAGRGTVRLAGMPDRTTGDGKYSLNDADFKSLPATQTAKLAVGDS